MSRQLKKDLISEYRLYCEDSEVPELFTVWCAISMVGACLRRNVWLDWGHFMIYPNLFVILVAGSGRCKKSSAIRVVTEVLEKVEPPLSTYSQKLTPQALILALSRYRPDDDFKRLQHIAEGIVLLRELGTLLNKGSFEDGMIDFLDDLYDSPDGFIYETIKRGQVHVPKSCISILGATTESWIQDVFPQSSIGAGFTSRLLFVYRLRPEKLIPRPIVTAENKKRLAAIIHDLNIVSSLRGEFKLSSEAYKVYEKEYYRWHQVMEGSFFDDSRLSGYASRRMTTLLKVAMAMSASVKDDLIIDDVTMIATMKILMNVEVHMKKVMDAITIGPIGEYMKSVLTLIKRWKKCTRSRVLQQVSHKMSARDLSAVIETLEQAKWVKVTHTGRSTFYEYVKDSFTDRILA